jgi:DnaJ-domain-containing protein 1
VTDYFALLDVPKRPWLEAEALKQRFLVLSAEMHPDRVHGASDAEKRAAHHRYTELNAAFQFLSRPRERVRHLLELETGTKGEQLQNVPSALMDFFMEFSSLCRQTDSFLAEKAAAHSPLLRVQLFERGQEWSEKISAVQKRLEDWRQETETELKRLDSEWPANWDGEKRAGTRGRLDDISRTLGFIERWSSQLRERYVQLAI